VKSREMRRSRELLQALAPGSPRFADQVRPAVPAMHSNQSVSLSEIEIAVLSPRRLAVGLIRGCG